jgi:hypothetical protein
MSKINNTNLHIILTIPHSVELESELNDNEKERTHDVSAMNVALSIKDEFNKYNINVTIISSHQNRNILDDNRYKGIDDFTIKKNSKLWSELKEEVRSLYQNINNIIIIDCHSFPSGGFGNFSSINEEHKIVFIDYHPYQRIVTFLHFYLNKNNIKTSIFEGSIGNNSILDIFTLHPLYIPTILIEVREDINIKEIKKIASIISNGIIKFINTDSMIATNLNSDLNLNMNKKYKFNF